MKTDLCGEDVIVHLANANPQILTETVNLMGGGTVGPGLGAGGGVARASSAAVECGRRLLLAARAGDTDTVRHLMAKGAPFTTDWLGTSPLHLAAANDHCETVGVLLRAGVSRDARTKVERTPLHLAAYAGHANSVTKLLEGGAAVDARDLLRMTPLHWAVERGHAEAARALLRLGADPHAESKFLKTPLSLAAAAAQRGDGTMLRLIEDCLKEREAAYSVDALVTERTAEEAAIVTQPETPTVRIQRITDTKIASPKIISTPEKKQIKTAIKFDAVGGGAAGAVGGTAGAVGVGAEALLRRHGITLLPADDGSTVLSALQSGRTVVLSDAGKLMLKESSSTPGSISTESLGGARGAGGGEAGAGVVLTATPVAAPPPGVKVFTLNSSAKLLPLKEQKQPAAPPAHPAPPTTPAPPAPPAQTIRRGSDKSDVQQVKLVPAWTTPAGGGGKAGAGAGRAAVRIIMNKQNFRKLIATATRATAVEVRVVEELDCLNVHTMMQPFFVGCCDSADMEMSEGDSSGSEDGESVVVVPEQFVRSSSPQYLRSQLLCAHAALHHLHRRLTRTRARMALLQAQERADR